MWLESLSGLTETRPERLGAGGGEGGVDGRDGTGCCGSGGSGISTKSSVVGTAHTRGRR